MTRHPALTGLALTVPLLVAAGCGSSGSSGSGGGQHQAAPIVRTLAAVATSTDPTTSGITAQGSGIISGSPNVLTLQIGVQLTAPHAVDAMARDVSRTNAVIGSLKAHGVAAADIQTGELSLSPNYNQAGVVAGYQVTDMLTAKLRDLSKAGAAIDAAVAAAGDAGRLQSVSFSIDDSSALMAQARKQAVAAARTKAQQLADAAGVKLGSLRSVIEDANQTPYPMFDTAAKSAAVPTPIQPGMQQLTVQVTAVWNVNS